LPIDLTFLSSLIPIEYTIYSVKISTISKIKTKKIKIDYKILNKIELFPIINQIFHFRIKLIIKTFAMFRKDKINFTGRSTYKKKDNCKTLETLLNFKIELLKIIYFRHKIKNMMLEMM